MKKKNEKERNLVTKRITAEKSYERRMPLCC